MKSLPIGARFLPRRPKGARETELPLRPISNWMLLFGAVAVVVAGVGLTWWLLNVVSQPPTQDPAVRIEAIKTGLSAAAGTGGAFALLLAFRRQRSTEVSAVHTITDASERRVTELYTKAADQLGSDKAPVRLAGLYALERLAQDNRGQRQTIVNVICAYLQMPYTPAGALPAEPSIESQASEEDEGAEGQRSDEDSRYEKRREEHERRTQEHRVRTTAQQILHRHLSVAKDGRLRWNTIIDLSGAFLAEVTLTKADLREANFRAADLLGASLTGADLTHASLTSAILCEADFNGVDLTGADLTGADLTGADLTGADLTDAHLPETNLLAANFSKATLISATLARAHDARAFFTGADLTRANLAGADLTKACLNKARLFGAELSAAFLTAANLIEADLTEADLTATSLTGANLTKANLTKANLTKANLTDALLADAVLTGADLTEANFDGVELTGAIWDDKTTWPPHVINAIQKASVSLSDGGYRVDQIPFEDESRESERVG